MIYPYFTNVATLNLTILSLHTFCVLLLLVLCRNYVKLKYVILSVGKESQEVTYCNTIYVCTLYQNGCT